jgi:RNA polymerase sigma-70 factor (ECF subfamily)
MTDWNFIVGDHGPVAWQAAYRLLGSAADADDCLQEALFSAFEMEAREPIRNWPGLLQHLATARALDSLRCRKRQAGSPITGNVAKTTGDSEDPMQKAADAELVDRLLESLAELPPQQAQTFCLRHLSALSYREIAQASGLSVDAVGVQLHRAAAALRELLDRPVGRLRR